MKRRFCKVKENDCNINYHETKIVFANFLKDKEESFLGIISKVIIFRLRIPKCSVIQGLAQVSVEWGEKWVGQSAAFHRRLLSALRERDANRVEQLLTEVFDNLEKEFIQVLQKVPWVDSSTDKVEKSLQ